MTRSSEDTAPCRTRGEPLEADITDKQGSLTTRLDQSLFVLEAEHYDTLMETLVNPPEPGPKLVTGAKTPCFNESMS